MRNAYFLLPAEQMLYPTIRQRFLCSKISVKTRTQLAAIAKIIAAVAAAVAAAAVAAAGAGTAMIVG